MIALTLALVVTGALVVAKVTLAAIPRLGLDTGELLVWLGVAEPPEEPVRLRLVD